MPGSKTNAPDEPENSLKHRTLTLLDVIYTVLLEIKNQLLVFSEPGQNLRVNQKMEKKKNPTDLPCVQPLGEWMYSRFLCLCQSVQDMDDGFHQL